MSGAKETQTATEFDLALRLRISWACSTHSWNGLEAASRST